MQVCSWIMVAVGLFAPTEGTLSLMIGCLGTMAVLAFFFFREFFKALRERRANEQSP